MKTIIPVLTGAALAMLAGSALAGQSTPKEREVTRQLNIEQAQQAKSANEAASAGMQGQSASRVSPAIPAESTPAAAPGANQGNADQGADPTRGQAAPAQ